MQGAAVDDGEAPRLEALALQEGPEQTIAYTRGAVVVTPSRRVLQHTALYYLVIT